MVKGDFDSTTATWKKRPKFPIEKTDDFTRTVATKDKVYRFVNAGTRAHFIYPRRINGRLRFFSSRPKTQANVLGSGPNTITGGPFYAQRVYHPGARARKFPKAVVKLRGSAFRKAIWAAFYGGK